MTKSAAAINRKAESGTKSSAVRVLESLIRERDLRSDFDRVLAIEIVNALMRHDLSAACRGLSYLPPIAKRRRK
jgi:hypothetical protein